MFLGLKEMFQSVSSLSLTFFMQNCQIMLKNVNLPNEIIRESVCTMDMDDNLTKDMVEQVGWSAKYIFHDNNDFFHFFCLYFFHFLENNFNFMIKYFH